MPKDAVSQATLLVVNTARIIVDHVQGQSEKEWWILDQLRERIENLDDLIREAENAA